MKEIYRVVLCVDGTERSLSVTARTPGGAERRAVKLAGASGASVRVVSCEAVHYEQLKLTGGGIDDD